MSILGTIVKDLNKIKHERKLVCKNCKDNLVNAKQSQKGVTPPRNEAQIHHDPAIKDGGTRNNSLPVVLCPPCHQQRHLNER